MSAFQMISHFLKIQYSVVGQIVSLATLSGLPSVLSQDREKNPHKGESKMNSNLGNMSHSLFFILFCELLHLEWLLDIVDTGMMLQDVFALFICLFVLFQFFRLPKLRPMQCSTQPKSIRYKRNRKKKPGINESKPILQFKPAKHITCAHG